MKTNSLVLFLILIIVGCLFVACPNTGTTITPVPDNTSPVADAGEDFILNTDIDGAVISLDASLSSDPDEDDLNYLWELESVPTGCLLQSADIVDSATVNASLDISGSQMAADAESGLIEFVFQLTVSDEEDESVDTLTVTVQGSSSINIGVY